MQKQARVDAPPASFVARRFSQQRVERQLWAYGIGKTKFCRPVSSVPINIAQISLGVREFAQVQAMQEVSVSQQVAEIVAIFNNNRATNLKPKFCAAKVSPLRPSLDRC